MRPARWLPWMLLWALALLAATQAWAGEPARRIISLAPFLTEIAYAAGAGERLVGAVSYSDYPPAARELPRVGGYKKIDLEAALALKPDLVLAWESGNPPAALDKLRALDIPVLVAEPRSFEDIAALIEAVGVRAGTSVTARAEAAAFRDRVATLRARYAGRETVSVFYQIWHRPLMTVNDEHLISAAIRLCGGHNVFADMRSLAAGVSLEAVLEADPRAIVASGMGEARPEWLDQWRRWPWLQAVRNGHLFFIPPQLIQRHSPRVLDGTERLCRQLDRVRREAAADPGAGRGPEHG